MKELNEVDIDGILILSGVGTFFLILNSLFFVNNIPSGGYGYGVLYLVMKYFAPLMMLAVFISSIYGKIKQYKINRKKDKNWKNMKTDEVYTYLMEGRLKQMKYELDFLNEFVKSDYVNPEEVIKTRINYLKEMIKEFKNG